MIGTPQSRGPALRRAGAVAALGAGAALLAGRRSRIAAGLLALGGLGLAWSTLRPTNPLLGPVARGGPRDRPTVSLVVASAPGPGTEALLAALSETGLPATFFLEARRVAERPDAVRLIRAGGHALANAGHDGSPIAFRTPAQVARQLRRTEESVAQVLGEDVVERLFMAPLGLRGPGTWAGAHRAGYRMVGWSRAVWPELEPDPEACARRAVGGLEPGAVIALGPESGGLPEAGPVVVRALADAARARGLTFVPLRDLIGQDAAVVRAA